MGKTISSICCPNKEQDPEICNNMNSIEKKKLKISEMNESSRVHIAIANELKQTLFLRTLDIKFKGSTLPMGNYEEPTRAREDIHLRYNFGKVDIGGGHFGIVKKARLKGDNHNKCFAIKIAERNVNDRSDLDVFLRELEYLKAFDHPNIVKFHEVYQDETKYYLVMEYLSGGDLLAKTLEEKGFPETQVKNLVWQMLLSVNYLHSRKICHRDIKPENFLIKNRKGMDLKLIDFG